MDETIIEGNGDPTMGRMSFSLVLLKAQEFVGIVNVRVAQVFDIAETHARIEAKDEGITDILFLELIASIHKFLNLLLREHIFFEHLVINDTNNSLAWIFRHDALVYGRAHHLLESLQDALGPFTDATSLKIFGKLYHHFMSDGIGPYEVFQQRMELGKKVLETIEGNLNHADVFLSVAADVRLVVVEEVDAFLFLQSITLAVVQKLLLTLETNLLG